MSRIFLWILFFVCVDSSVFAQADELIALGDSYQQVVEKIESDPSYEFLKVIKSSDRIVTYNDPSAPLVMRSVWEYHFRNRRLAQIFMIIDPPDVDRAITGMYRLLVEQNNTLTVVKKNGYRAYHYTTPKGETYIYKAFSDWFQKTCEIILIEHN